MAKPEPQEGPDWTVIYDGHSSALRAATRRALGWEPRALLGTSADDVAQEVFSEVIGEGLRYVGAAPQLRRYLRRRTGWVLSDLFEEASRFTEPGRDDPEQPEARLPSDRAGPTPSADPSADVDDRLNDEWALATSREHFRCLTPHERWAIVERLEKQRPARELAEELGVTPTWIRELVRNAGKKLKQCLEDPNHA